MIWGTRIHRSASPCPERERWRLCRWWRQWFYGREAIRYAQEGQGILVEHLLTLALDGEPVVIEGESFEPAALLALFFKRSLGMLSQAGYSDKIEALMITCETFNSRLFEVLKDVEARIRLVGVKITFQSYTESYYSYMINQPEALWIQQSVLFYYQGGRIRAYGMKCNRGTIPITVFIEECQYPFHQWTGLPEEEGERAEKMRTQAQEAWKGCYEKAYGIPLEYAD